MAGPLQITSLDFSKIREELKAYLSSKTEFTDYNFEGSDLTYLIDALSYVTNFNGYVANSAFNETNLLTAQQRKNLVINSHDLSYDVDRAVPSIATIRIKLTDTVQVTDKYPAFDFNLDSLILPRFSQFISNDGTNFITTEDVIFNSSNDYTVQITIRQGSITRLDKFGVSTGLRNQRFRLNESNMASIIVELDVNNERWNNVQDITLYEPSSQYYQIQENFRETYDFIFGDDLLGSIPDNNSDISLRYMITSGNDGNNKSDFVLLGSAYVNGSLLPTNEIDNTAFTTTTIVRSNGGKNKEDTELIRRNAPMWYQSQGRAITESDYLVRLRKHPLVEFVNVYGGEELNPPQYGFIYATIKPPGADSLTSEQEDNIIAYMEPFHIKGIRFRILPATFINVEVDVRVNYDLKSISQTSVLDSIRNTTRRYFLGVGDENQGFFFSNLICDIDETTGVLSTRIYNKFYLDILPSTDNVYFYNIGQEIVPGSIDLIFNTTQGWIDDSNGSILDRETNTPIGTINYKKGIISITNYSKLDTDEKIYFETESGDMELHQNVLIRYDESNSKFSARAITRSQ
jgi:hypothetical protein